jgi:hypothetical protein
MQHGLSHSFGKCIALALALAGLAAPAQAAPPQPVNLDEAGWEYAHAPTGPWAKVTLPHVMDGRPIAAAFPGEVAWYRLRFRGPRAPEGGGWSVRFEGVRRRSEVFLNGQRLGANDDPYTPFTLPATRMREGRENLLVVRGRPASARAGGTGAASPAASASSRAGACRCVAWVCCRGWTAPAPARRRCSSTAG